MRLLRKVLLSVAGTVVLLVFVGFCWLYFYTLDLPDTSVLAQSTPAFAAQATDPCSKVTIVAISYEALGTNFRLALDSAEARPAPDRATLGTQISRMMFCEPSKALKRHFDELRMSYLLERRFTSQQLITIYANRSYFGDDVYGVQAAAQHFFGKDPNQLTLAEAALIAGLLKSPSRYSPAKHPDRALQRRNEVIDLMLADRSAAIGSAQAAKSAPLGVIASVDTTAAQ